MSTFFGKYRALVVNNKDPEKMGRIKVRCPKVLGEYESAWCTPCVQSAFNDGGFFFVPNVNETVWIEFEEGNPSKPIWVGSWWVPNRTPMQSSNNVEDKILLVSRNQHLIEIDDKNNTIVVKMKDGSRLKLGDGLEITAPTGKKLVVYGNVEFRNEVTISGQVTVNNNVKVSNDISTKSLQASSFISEGGTSLANKYAPR